MTRIARRLDDNRTAADRFLGALVFESEMRRGATKAELIELAAKQGRLDVVEYLTRPVLVGDSTPGETETGGD